MAVGLWLSLSVIVFPLPQDAKSAAAAEALPETDGDLATCMAAEIGGALY